MAIKEKKVQPALQVFKEIKEFLELLVKEETKVLPVLWEKKVQPVHKVLKEKKERLD